MLFRIMKIIYISLCMTCFLYTQTPKEAEEFVKKAIIVAKVAGKQVLINEVNKQNGQFNFNTTKSLYISIYAVDGKILAHGANPKHIGMNHINAKDVNGKLYVKERIDLALSKGRGWVEYVEVNPVTKTEQSKHTYIEFVDGMIISCGAYHK